MADYRTDLYASVDQQFATMGGAKDHFAEDNILEDPTAYEAQLPAQIQPTGWVENSDPDLSGGASVLIDSDGITILNGKIFLSDPGGNTVLSPAGFGGSWIDFLADRFYNSKFQYGTLGVIPESIVSGADSPADYADSLSTALPYWIIDNISGTGAPELISDAAASGGRALKWPFDNDSAILQDVPITPGRNYGVLMSWKYKGAGLHFVTRTVGLSWRDSTHAIIGAVLETGLTFFSDQATYINEEIAPALAVAPANAAYLRISVEIDTTSAATAEATINSMRVTESTLESMDKISFGGAGISYFTYDTSGIHVEGPFIVRDDLYFSSSDGATLDAYITRSAASVLTLDTLAGSDTAEFRAGRLTSYRSDDGAGLVLDASYAQMGNTPVPSAPAADTIRFVANKSAGKMRFVIKWPGGASTVVATEP